MEKALAQLSVQQENKSEQILTDYEDIIPANTGEDNDYENEHEDL